MYRKNSGIERNLATHINDEEFVKGISLFQIPRGLVIEKNLATHINDLEFVKAFNEFFP